MKRIGILHYAGPPTVGGVESTIAHHALALSRLDYAVRILSATDAAPDPTTLGEHTEINCNPLFGSSSPAILKVKAELDNGNLTDNFTRLVSDITEGLKTALAGCDVCIAHNVLTLNKNLPLTAALAALNEQEAIRIIGWCHDLAWTNEQYKRELYPRRPWTLLNTAWPAVTYVTVSEPRRYELAELLQLDPASVEVVVPGVDPESFFHWTPTTSRLDNSLHLLDADGILLLPARITRRKNIALGLHVLAELRRQSGKDFRLIVTGPPGPHNPANPGYLGELLKIRDELQLGNSAHFLYAYGQDNQPLIPDDDTMSNLYQLADALFFPSTQEGFGIPVLEAGLTALPAFCADIPALRTTGQDDAQYFDPVNDSPSDIAARILAFFDSNAAYRLRVRVRQTYRWDVIVQNRLVPLIENTGIMRS